MIKEAIFQHNWGPWISKVGIRLFVVNRFGVRFGGVAQERAYPLSNNFLIAGDSFEDDSSVGLVPRPSLQNLEDGGGVPASLDDEGIAACSMLTFLRDGSIISVKERGKLNISAVRSVAEESGPYYPRAPKLLTHVLDRGPTGVRSRIDGL